MNIKYFNKPSKTLANKQALIKWCKAIAKALLLILVMFLIAWTPNI